MGTVCRERGDDTISLARSDHVPCYFVLRDARHKGLTPQFRNEPALPLEFIPGFLKRGPTLSAPCTQFGVGVNVGRET